jgi:hypothetical protein
MAAGMLLLTSAVLWSALTCSVAARFYTPNRDTSTLIVLSKLFFFTLGGTGDPAEQQVWYGRRHAVADKRGALERAHLLSCRAFLHTQQGQQHVDSAFMIIVANAYIYIP